MDASAVGSGVNAMGLDMYLIGRRYIWGWGGKEDGKRKEIEKSFKELPEGADCSRSP